MMKIHLAANLDYYLGKVVGADGKENNSEAFGLIDVDSLAARLSAGETLKPVETHYYNKALASDPLAREGFWIGDMAKDLGLGERCPVDQRSFALLYYGCDPRTGKPLKDDIPSIQEQRSAQAKIWAATKRLEETGKDKARLWEAAKAKGASREKWEASPEGKKALKAETKAKEKLVEAKKLPGNRQAAHDIHLDAPKDVSLLIFALKKEGRDLEARQVEEAWVSAAASVLKDVESDFLKVRPRNGNSERTIESVKGAAIACFTHFDARPTPGADPDPHLHVHGVLMAQAQGFDDEYRASWTDFVNTSAPMLGTKARALFAARFAGLGLGELRPEVGKDMVSFGIAGISKEQSRQFSKRSDQIRENEESGLSGNDARVKDRQSKEIGGQEFIDSVGRRLEAAGVSAERCQKMTVEKEIEEKVAAEMKIALESGLLKELDRLKDGKPLMKKMQEGSEAWETERKRRIDAERAKLNVGPQEPEKLIEKLTELSPTFTVLDVEKVLWQQQQFIKTERRPGETEIQAAERNVKERLDALLKEPELMLADGIDKKTKQPKFTTKKQREAEREFYGKLLPEMLAEGSARPVASEIIEAQIAATEKENGFPFSDKQREAVRFLTGGQSQASVLVAWAGSGKTTLAKAAVKAWKADGRTVLAMAPSNAAAENLRKEIGAENHYTPERLAKELEKPDSKLKLDKDTVLYIDEASMLDFRETAPILEAARQAGAKVVFCGDPAQLPAVGLGNILRNITNEQAYKPAVYQITSTFDDAGSIQRQKHYWGKQATALLSTGKIAEAFETYDRRGCVKLYSDGSEMLGDAIDSFARRLGPGGARMEEANRALRNVKAAFIPGEAAKKAQALSERDAALLDLQNVYRDQLMIATTNETVGKLNKLARAKLKEIGALAGQEIEIGAGKDIPLKVCVGERLYFEEKAKKTQAKTAGTKDKGEEIGKAMVGTVLEIRNGRDGEPRLLLELDEKDLQGKRRQVEIDPRLYSDFSHAYALTVHKSQGASVGHVEFVATAEDASKGVFASMETALVALTRHKVGLTIRALQPQYDALVKASSRSMEKIEADELVGSFLQAAGSEKAEALIDQINKEEAASLAEIEKTAEACPHVQLEDAPLATPEPSAPEPGASFKIAGAALARESERILAMAEKSDPLPASEALAGELELIKETRSRPLGEGVVALGVADLRGSAMAEWKSRQWIAADSEKKILFGINEKSGQVEARDYADLGADAEAAYAVARMHCADLAGTPRPEPKKPGEEKTATAGHAETRGKLVEFGKIPHPERPTSRPEFRARLRLANGTEKDIFGADLERALEASDAKIGQEVAVARVGETEVPEPIFEGETLKGFSDKKVRKNLFQVKIAGLEDAPAASPQDAASAEAAKPLVLKNEIRGELLALGRIPHPERPDAPPAFRARVKLAGGIERDVFGADLERALGDAGAKIGDDVRFGAEGETKVKVPVFEDGKIVRWTEKEFKKTLFKAEVIPLAPGQLSRAEKAAAAEIARDALADPSLRLALGLAEGNGVFEGSRHEIKVVGIREPLSGLDGAGAFKLGVQDAKAKTSSLHLVVLGQTKDGKVLCATPLDEARLKDQPLGASCSEIFAFDKKELPNLGKGQGFVAAFDEQGQASFARAESRLDQEIAKGHQEIAKQRSLACVLGSVAGIDAPRGEAIVQAKSGGKPLWLRLPMEGEWKGQEAALEKARCVEHVIDVDLSGPTPKPGSSPAMRKALRLGAALASAQPFEKDKAGNARLVAADERGVVVEFGDDLRRIEKAWSKDDAKALNKDLLKQTIAVQIKDKDGKKSIHSGGKELGAALPQEQERARGR